MLNTAASPVPAPATAGAGGGGYVPKRKETWHELTRDQLHEACLLAQSRGPGRFRLREIYGDEWPSIFRPQRFGVLFKRAVVAGVIPGVRWIGRRSDKSQLYEVLA